MGSLNPRRTGVHQRVYLSTSAPNPGGCPRGAQGGREGTNGESQSKLKFSQSIGRSASLNEAFRLEGLDEALRFEELDEALCLEDHRCPASNSTSSRASAMRDRSRLDSTENSWTSLRNFSYSRSLASPRSASTFRSVGIDREQCVDRE